MRDGFETNNQERQLDELFAAYRAACPEPDASAEFMPRLWARIEERQRGQVLFVWRRCAQAFLGLAAAVSLFLIVLQVLPHQTTTEAQTTYLDQLSEDDRRAETFFVTASMSTPPAPGPQQNNNGAPRK